MVELKACPFKNETCHRDNYMAWCNDSCVFIEYVKLMIDKNDYGPIY